MDGMDTMDTTPNPVTDSLLLLYSVLRKEYSLFSMSSVVFESGGVLESSSEAAQP